MRVIQIVRGFGPAGGSGRVAWELHQGLVRRGVDSHIVTGKLAGDVPIDTARLHFVVPGLVGREDRGGWRGRLARLFSVPAFTLWSTRVVRRMRRRTDIVLSHGDSLTGDIIVMHSVHRAAFTTMLRGGYLMPLLNPLHGFVLLRNRFLFRRGQTQRIVVVGRRLAAEMQRHYDVDASNLVYIPNGIDTAAFAPRQGPSALRRELGLPPDARVALFVGHEFRRKGLEYVLRAAALARTRLHVLVVGGDAAAPFRARARELGLEDRVVFTGRRADMPEVFRASDVFVFPTLYEAFPLACIEAMASGLPVIATPVGGIEDIVVHGDNGFLTGRNAHEIAACIDRLFASETVAARMAAAARATALHYSWDNITARYLALIREVAAARTQAPPGDAPPPAAPPPTTPPRA